MTSKKTETMVEETVVVNTPTYTARIGEADLTLMATIADLATFVPAQLDAVIHILVRAQQSGDVDAKPQDVLELLDILVTIRETLEQSKQLDIRRKK